MAELNGYLLSTEEEKACLDLVKELRKRTTFAVDFSGYVKIKAKTRQEANNIFWQWVESMQDTTSDDWFGIVSRPLFEKDGVEEE